MEIPFASTIRINRRVLPAWLKDALLQAIAASDDGERLAVAVLHEAGAHHVDDVVVLRLKDFRDWFVGEATDGHSGDSERA